MDLTVLLNNYKDFKAVNFPQNNTLNHKIIKLIFIDKEYKFKNINKVSNSLVLFEDEESLNKQTIQPLLRNKNILGFNFIPKNKEKFPYILIPKLYNLKDLAIDILNLISENQFKENTFNRKLQKDFLSIDINKSSLKDYLNYLESYLDRELIYLNNLDGQIYKTKELFLGQEDIKANLEKLSEKYFIKEIKEFSQVFSYLIIDAHPGELSPAEKSLINSISNILLIKIKNQITIDNLKEVTKSDLIADICMNNIKSKEEVSFRAAIQGWSIESGLLAVIFDIDEFKHSLLHSNKKFEELEQEKQIIFNLITKEMELINYPSYFYRKSDSIIFLVNIELENNFSALDSFVEKNILPIHKIFDRNKFNFTLTIGIGTYHKDIMDTYKSYNEAVEAVNISRIFKEVDDISCYKDVVIFKDLMEIMIKRDYNSIYTNLLKNIRKMDQKNNTEYFTTLKSIVKNDWNLKNSSKDLFIHYNTILYRYEKIKELLGMDLNQFYEKLIITLTIMMLEVEKHLDFNKGIFKK